MTIKGETETRKYFKQYYINDRVDDIKASIVDGVLTLDLILSQPEEPKRIEVKPSVPQIEG